MKCMVFILVLGTPRFAHVHIYQVLACERHHVILKVNECRGVSTSTRKNLVFLNVAPIREHHTRQQHELHHLLVQGIEPKGRKFILELDYHLAIVPTI